MLKSSSPVEGAADRLRECKKDIEKEIRCNEKEIVSLRRQKKEVCRKLRDKDRIRQEDLREIKELLKLLRSSLKGWEDKYNNLLNYKVVLVSQVDKYGRIEMARHDLPFWVQPCEDLYDPKRDLKDTKKGLDELCKDIKSLEKRYKKLKEGLR